MIHHPKNELIDLYAKGNILTPLASIISAHLEICQSCHSLYMKSLQSAAEDLETFSPTISQQEVEHAFDFVMDKIELELPTQAFKKTEPQVKIQVSGQVFELPSSLSFLRGQEIKWKEFGQKNAIAPIVTTGQGNFYLIYIGPGESIPEHSHSLAEYSYVAAGSFKDDISVYETGDFCVTNDQVSHSPVATSSDGCLVISWVEGRLNFFKGIYRPLNSFLWWYLHRA